MLGCGAGDDQNTVISEAVGADVTRELRVVPADDVAVVLAALRTALTADGPAVLPVAAGFDGANLPRDVPQRVALVVETSGSTGRPKRVALSTDALLSSAAASASALGGPGQWLLALPAHYIAGINVLVRSIVAETPPVLLGDGHFDASQFVHAANRMDHAVRFTALVPAQLRRLLDAEHSDLETTIPTLRRFDRILIGGQSMPQDLLALVVKCGLHVTRTYGSSETSGGCVYDGLPIGMTAVRFTDGEVELGGPTLAERYLDPELTAQRFYADDGMRWFRTGDTGILLDGVLRVTGRIDDVIVSGGIKVSLSAVERVVRTLPGLSDAVVVSASDPDWGEAPIVIATVAVDLGVVRARVAGLLGAAARPARIDVVERIPYLSSGKPDRVALAGR